MANARVIGVDRFRSDLAEAMKTNRDVLNSGMRQMIEAMADQIKANCPTKTGALKNSIHVAEGKNRHGPSQEVVIGNDSVDYAMHVEYGTSREPAHPFVRPAVEMLRQKYPGQMEALISDTWKGK